MQADGLMQTQFYPLYEGMDMRKVLTGWVTAILAVSFVATCPAEETDTVRLVMPD